MYHIFFYNHESGKTARFEESYSYRIAETYARKLRRQGYTQIQIKAAS